MKRETNFPVGGAYDIEVTGGKVPSAQVEETFGVDRVMPEKVDSKAGGIQWYTQPTRLIGMTQLL